MIYRSIFHRFSNLLERRVSSCYQFEHTTSSYALSVRTQRNSLKDVAHFAVFFNLSKQTYFLEDTSHFNSLKEMLIYYKGEWVTFEWSLLRGVMNLNFDGLTPSTKNVFSLWVQFWVSQTYGHGKTLHKNEQIFSYKPVASRVCLILIWLSPSLKYRSYARKRAWIFLL